MTGLDSLEDAALSIDALTVRVGEDGVAAAEDSPVALSDLFTAPFVREHTDATTFEAFVAGSPLDGATEHDGRGDLDAYVAAHSEFESWEEMAAAAKTAWLERELGLL